MSDKLMIWATRGGHQMADKLLIWAMRGGHLIEADV